MLRYAISDRKLYPGDTAAQLAAVVQQAVLLSRDDVAYLQLREKDLPEEELFALTCAVRDAVAGSRLRVVLNGPRTLAERADVGWHRSATAPEAGAAASISCHTLADVEAARAHAAVLLFGPVFEKRVRGTRVLPGVGLRALEEAVACAAATPVLALGGVTERNAAACVTAGAAGFASIRSFVRSESQQKYVW